MVYCFVHLLDDPDPADGEEEVYIVVPDTSKVAMAIPLEALPAFLPLLDQAVCDLPLPECPACGATMPTRAMCAAPHDAPPPSR